MRISETIRWSEHIQNTQSLDMLKLFGLITLDRRRSNGDLIYMYKLTKMYESLKWKNNILKIEIEVRRANLQGKFLR